MNYKKGILIALVAILVAAAGFLSYRYFAGEADYVVKVNNEKVSPAEFKFMLDAVKAQMEQTGLTNFNTTVDGKKASDLAKERALESIENYKIEAQKAKERGITLNSDEVKSIDETINNLSTQNPQIIERLKQAGLSTSDFRKIYVEFSLADKLREQILKDYYEKNKSKYTAEEEEVRARHILFKTTDNQEKELLADQQEQKKTQAEQILARAKAGEDFATLAKQYSEDPGSKDNGGEYTFKRGDMVKEFEDAAFSLKPGEISGLVKTKFGYHIIKLEEKFEKGNILNYEAVRDKVLNDVQYDKTLEDWKKNSKIEKNEKVYNSIQL